MVEDIAIKKAWMLLVDGRRQFDKEGIEDVGGWQKTVQLRRHGGCWWMIEHSAIKKVWRLLVDGRRPCNEAGVKAAGGW